MLLSNTTQSGVVESSGYGETTRATIATSAHMFRVLSGLYSDTIGAVLREIGCNAADAHTDAGQPLRPIEVKLPNAVDRTFYIKDHGNGLDEEAVRGLYLTYGASTKRDRADLIGALGLGCKSPLAYTHTFTVVSAHGGMQRHFTVYLDDTGVPAVAKTGEVPASADWPHGLMVTFPVQPSDFSAFANKARALYRWFAVPPTLLGVGMGEELRPLKARYSLGGGLLRARFSEATSSGVVMGSIRYPYDSATMWGGVTESALAPVPTQLRDRFRTLSNRVFTGDVTLSAALGEVMFVPSREHLDYNPATIRSLVSLQYRALEALASHVRTELELLKDLARYPQAQKHSALHALLEAFNISTVDNARTLAAIGGFESDEALMVPLRNLVMAPGIVTLGRDVGGRMLLGGGSVAVRLTSASTGDSKVLATSRRIEYGYQPGKTKDGKPVEVHLAANEGTALVMIDVKGVTVSVLKELLGVLGITRMLTVQPVKGCTADQAQAYVDTITGPSGSLSGMPMKRLSEMVSPEALVKQARERVKRSQAERLAATNCLVVGPGGLERFSVADAIDGHGCTHYVVLADGYSLDEGLRKYAYFEAGSGTRPMTQILADTCQHLTWLLKTYGMPVVDDDVDDGDEEGGNVETSAQSEQEARDAVTASDALPTSAYEPVTVGGVLVLTKPAAARLKLKDMGLRDLFADAHSAATHPALKTDILEVQSRNFTIAKLNEALTAHNGRGLGDLLRRVKRLSPVAYSRVTSLLGANSAVHDAMLVVEAETQLAQQANTYANKALQAALGNPVAARIMGGGDTPAALSETLTTMVQAAARVAALPSTAPLDHSYFVAYSSSNKESLAAEQLPSWVAAWLSVNRLDEDLVTASRTDQAQTKPAGADGVNVVSFEAARLTRPAFPLKPTAQAGAKG